MVGDNKGLVLVTVSLDTKRTTISLDDKLFGYLAAKLGSAESAIRWLRAEAIYQNRSGEAGALKSGLSRLVQRRALDVLLGGEPLGHGFDQPEGLAEGRA